MQSETYIEQNETFITIYTGHLKVILCTKGASIYKIFFYNEIMTLTPKNVSDFLSPRFYYGKTIGRIANRVEGGIIRLNGSTFHMDCNEGDNSLHSGSEGLSNKSFSYLIKGNGNKLDVVFSYFSSEKEQSLPGNVHLDVTYSFKESENKIYLSIDAKSDILTPLSFTNHTYFNLSEKNIDNLSLFIKAHQFIETNKFNLLPIHPRIVENCLDFSILKKMKENLFDSYIQNHKAKGYDHCFLLDDHENDEVITTLENEKYRLNIYTNFPAIQIYSCNYSDNIPFCNVGSGEHVGVAIEPEESIFEPNFCKEVHRDVIYSFEVK